MTILGINLHDAFGTALLCHQKGYSALCLPFLSAITTSLLPQCGYRQRRWPRRWASSFDSEAMEAKPVEDIWSIVRNLFFVGPSLIALSTTSPPNSVPLYRSPRQLQVGTLRLSSACQISNLGVKCREGTALTLPSAPSPQHCGW